MVAKLIEWALNSRIIVLFLTAAVAVYGYHSFTNINVEAYPDPAPAIIEVVAQWPGASAEEMERLVTNPLEVTLAGMPGLKVTYSKSLFGLTHLRNVFHYGHPYKDARQEVINRLQFVSNLPPGCGTPQISPASPIGEIYRYTLKTPTDALGNEIYTLNDLKALQDWFIEREFRRVPGIIDVTSFGGTVKRYEVQPDPEKLKFNGITLGQIQNALANSNANVGGDFLFQGAIGKVVRVKGLIGSGDDVMQKAFSMKTPEEAAAYLRDAEQKRLRDIRNISVVSINNAPIKIDDLVVGPKQNNLYFPSTQGVVVGYQTRLGMVTQEKAMDRYRITDNTLAELKNTLPEDVASKLAPLKNKVYDTRNFLTAELATVLTPEEVVRYKAAILEHSVKAKYVLTNSALIPDAVLKKLELLKGREFKKRDDFDKELRNVLSKAELDHYRDLLLNYAETSRDVYQVTPVMLARLRRGRLPAAVPDTVLPKLIPLLGPHREDGEFATREALMKELHTVLSMQELEAYSFDILTQTSRFWRSQNEKVQGIILMRKGEKSVPTIEGVKAKVKELNQPGKLLPGVTLETYYDREDLVHLTTETVTHNLVLGIILVTVILMMFLSNVRTAVIVALNIPIALLIAFAVLYLKGESANLLSIGAVDFGIIVDSAVIMAENIYRHLAAGEHADLPLKDRVLRATREVDRALFFSTLIMVVAFIPLFTMQGAEGQLFGPMSQTYAFALGGALLMALTLTPVLCTLLLKDVKPVPENFLVRFLKNRYLWQLRVCLHHRYATVVIMGTIIVITAVWALPRVGREFMPELEEGSLWVRGVFPVHISLDGVKDPVKEARDIMSSERYPEVAAVVAQHGRPDDGTDPGLFNNVEVFVPLRPERDWPIVLRPNGKWQKRTRREIVDDMNAELKQKLPGIEWGFSQYIRDNVMEAISGVKGDNCVKIYGPDLEMLESLAYATKNEMAKIPGLESLGIYRIMGQSNLEFGVDKEKCKRHSVQVGDVINVINTAVRGNPMTQMVEGPMQFDITLRWPYNRRWDEDAIMQIPVDVDKNVLTAGYVASAGATTISGVSNSPSSSGTSNQPPAAPSQNVAPATTGMSQRVRIKDVVSPVGPDGMVIEAVTEEVMRKLAMLKNKEFATRADFVKELAKHISLAEQKLYQERIADQAVGKTYRLSDEGMALLRNPEGDFSRPGGSIISREQGKRFIAVKFSVSADLDLASAVEQVKEKTAGICQPPYQMIMGGEFEQMEDGERRLMFYIPISLILIFIILYIAFHSLLDAVVILSNVFDLAVGGIWALYLTGTNFSMSAAVGFVSLFGVAIMDGLLMIAYFNDLRAKGLPVEESIMKGAALRVRPVTMTCLTAILGLLPAAFSTAIGAQTQRPLAIVVVGGMLTTLFLTRYLMPVLYSFYGHREPPAGASSMAH